VPFGSRDVHVGGVPNVESRRVFQEEREKLRETSTIKRKMSQPPLLNRQGWRMHYLIGSNNSPKVPGLYPTKSVQLWLGIVSLARSFNHIEVTKVHSLATGSNTFVRDVRICLSDDYLIFGRISTVGVYTKSIYVKS
jgi:hypothetical protein